MARFYITTAIDYANSTPHLGTAYEKIGADVIARYRRLVGEDVYFVLGNDEHSQNVRRKAEEMGLEPKVYCDQMAEKFRETWRALGISNDFFIQTSMADHHAMVRDIANRIFSAKDSSGAPVIYKAPYEGHYCISCEAFFQEKDLMGGLCPNHKTKPQWIKEENYFFRLKSFAEPLRRLYADHRDFLRPETRRNEILKVLEQGLEDVSISRPSKGWGVRLPFDEKAVAYVWFDALINYMSAVGPVGGEKFAKYWPCDLHVIGKDITRFHCLIWPAMLMAAGISLPRGVWAHGFVSIQGEKMSKSRGNVADPIALSLKYGSETLRYYLIKEVPWDRDGDFSEDRLVLMYNANLANELGNLLSRTISMSKKYVGAEVPRPPIQAFGFELQRVAETVSSVRNFMDRYEISEAIHETWKLVTEANQLIDRTQPWAMAKDPSKSAAVTELMYVLLESLKWIGILLMPVMPEKSAELLRALGVTSTGSHWLLSQAGNPTDTTRFQLDLPKPLFPRIEPL